MSVGVGDEAGPVDGADPCPALDAALGVVAGALVECGVSRAATDQLVALTRGLAAHAGEDLVDDPGCPDDVLLDAAGAAPAVAAFSDGVSLLMLRSLATRAGVELLGRAGVQGPGELSSEARRRWRARTKSVVARELQVMSGLGIQECHDRVGVALAPPGATAVVRSGLLLGALSWREVRTWWRRCGSLTPEEAGGVAGVVFGDRVAQAERPAALPAGESPRRPSWAEFTDVLAREVTRVRGAHEQARQERRDAVRRRRMWAQISDDGTGTLSVIAPTECIAGAVDRIEAVARAARAAGDERTLDQLRADATIGLLVHGVIPLPEVPDGPLDADTLARLEGELYRLLRGIPATTIEVIVPLDALHAEDDETTRPDLVPPDPAPPHLAPPHPAPPDPVPPDPVPPDPVPPDPAPPDPAPPEPAPPDPAPPDLAPPDPAVGPPGRVDEPPGERSARRGSPPVAVLTGHGPITAEHARELAALPGTVWHRLVTDPLDGRLVERSIAAYRPDAAMVDQLRAADRTCRAPGCLVPARSCDLDHERPHGQGGPTSETNLNHKHRPDHALKTLRLWTTVMDRTRDVTWRTLFGRLYRTRGYDYRCLDGSGTAAAGGDMTNPELDGESTPPAGRAEAPTCLDPGEVTDPDLRSQLVYAALCQRDGIDGWLEALDDGPDTQDAWTDDPTTGPVLGRTGRTGRAGRAGRAGREPALQVIHRRPGGQVRRGPAPDHPGVLELLGVPPTPQHVDRIWGPDPDEPPPF